MKRHGGCRTERVVARLCASGSPMMAPTNSRSLNARLARCRSTLSPVVKSRPWCWDAPRKSGISRLTRMCVPSTQNASRGRMQPDLGAVETHAASRQRRYPGDSTAIVEIPLGRHAAMTARGKLGLETLDPVSIAGWRSGSNATDCASTRSYGASATNSSSDRRTRYLDRADGRLGAKPVRPDGRRLRELGVW